MSEKVLKSLVDIKLAIEEIDSFFQSRGKRFDEYQHDTILKRAVERNLEIIGEAVSRILKEDPGILIENAKRIIGLRNQIIHGYDNISDENIWGIVFNHLPRLQKEIDALIKNQT